MMNRTGAYRLPQHFNIFAANTCSSKHRKANKSTFLLRKVVQLGLSRFSDMSSYLESNQTSNCSVTLTER